MRREFQKLRAVFALVAALFLAAGSLLAPVSELTEDMHHAAAHADRGSHGSAALSVAGSADAGQPDHQHPDTPGHSHCGASCHVQMPDTLFALTIAYAPAYAPVVVVDENLRPAAHLDGLFRPPRA